MVRIGLISDTHGYLDPAVLGYFACCDEIWHAGDFGSSEIITQLEAIKPLRGVYGNIDDKEIRIKFKEQEVFTIEEVTILMQHIGGYPGRYAPGIKNAIKNNHAKVFISGHSHILKIMYDEQLQCLHINPGAAGKQGWHKTRTLIRFEIEGKEIKNCEVIELGNR